MRRFFRQEGHRASHYHPLLYAYDTEPACRLVGWGRGGERRRGEGRGGEERGGESEKGSHMKVPSLLAEVSHDETN